MSKTKNTAVVVTKNFATLPILEQLDKKIAAMKRIEESVYRTIWRNAQLRTL